MSLQMCNFYVYLHSTQGVDNRVDVTSVDQLPCLPELLCVLMLMFCHLVLARG